VKELLLGAGGVGEAIAIVARGRPWLKKKVLADHDLEAPVVFKNAWVNLDRERCLLT
jgi:hypothetical protein